MGRWSKSIWGVVALVTVTNFVTACGRNWCVGGAGPCEMFKESAENKKKNGTGNGGGGTSAGPCGNSNNLGIRDGLALSVAGGIGVQSAYTDSTLTLTATGGTGTFRFYSGNPAAQIAFPAGAAASTRSITFKTPNSTGYICLKVIDDRMNPTDTCDGCEIGLRVLKRP